MPDPIYPLLPDELGQVADKWWSEYKQAAAKVSVAPPEDPRTIAMIKHLWSMSDFIARGCIRYPDLVDDLCTETSGIGSDTHAKIKDRLAAALRPIADQIAASSTDPSKTPADDPMEALQRDLRRFRQREMIRIACLDILGLTDLDKTMAALSSLADACIDQTLTLLYTWQCHQYGVPRSKKGDAQYLVVLGLGKLGGRELNFSSDVDLIFAFPDVGQTDSPLNPLGNDVFFTRLAQRLVKALGAVTADGFVFRIDLRLRPDGDNGPLVMSFDNMEDYYQLQGREWERYAWIKARVVAGDHDAGQRLLTMLQPFVYRRYLDYGVFKALRDMKQKIAFEVKRKGMDADIKLGPGGIREIEFFGQIFQLLRGGVVADLRVRPIQLALRKLVEHGYIEAVVAEELIAAYIFLRQTEHRLQAVNDQQTHRLPAETLDRLRLAIGMGYADWPVFIKQLQYHRNNVQNAFNSLLAVEDSEQQDSDTQTQVGELTGIWEKPDVDEGTLQTLNAMGYEQPFDIIKQLESLKQSPATLSLSVDGRNRLDLLIPRVLYETAGTESPNIILARIIQMIESIQRRTCYIALLLENPQALKHLIRLVGASPWIASFLARRPVLLDELLDARTLYDPPLRSQMESDLRQKLASLAPEDLEYQIEELCIFRQIHSLRVAAADITDVLPLMRVSDYLSDIAETVLNEVIDISWEHLVQKHGKPASNLEGTPCERGFAVIAYGKLGGLELGYNSDLDLVFIHAGDQGQTEGSQNPLDNPQFFARLGQRVIHILTTHTAAGRIYEIDMRLRPSGTAGMLVSHYKGYKEYQSKDAWTWEHQALLRTRAISGDTILRRWFEKTRKEILTRPRDPDQLRTDIIDMRARMRKELLKPREDEFDLKQGHGGIVDIEFLVQYLVLLKANQYPQLVRWSDNVRQLQSLAENGILDENTAYFLRHAYLVYRATTHRLNLREQPSRVPDERFKDLRRNVRTIWRQYLGR